MKIEQGLLFRSFKTYLSLGKRSWKRKIRKQTITFSLSEILEGKNFAIKTKKTFKGQAFLCATAEIIVATLITYLIRSWFIKYWLASINNVKCTTVTQLYNQT
ncbi:hypothetical protein IPH25_01990 [bacterium]|nr:MAG: hypothetical protein IPG37_04120 [bacterium]QQR62195.1 MAG: hypothetical protein IPH25_01990 [bacterium]QQR63247.1 MAG: hypothetical protein IPH67_02110 [bacterium]